MTRSGLLEEDDARGQADYEVTVKGPGTSVHQRVSIDVAREAINILMGGTLAGSRGSDSRSGVVAPSRQSGTARSLREYLDSTGARRNPEKIVSIGRYLQDTRGQHTFTKAEVKAQFKNAAEPVPGNFPRDFTWGINSGWIAPDESGGYYVTNKGREAIDEQFPADVRRATKQGRRPRRRARKSSGENGEA